MSRRLKASSILIFSTTHLLCPQSERLLTELGVGGGSRQQDVVPASRSFPCRVSSNNSVGASPRSVHRLRPQDIDVVATMGDSLVTGFGALAESLFGLFLTNQQVSWSIGEFCCLVEIFCATIISQLCAKGRKTRCFLNAMRLVNIFQYRECEGPFSFFFIYRREVYRDNFTFFYLMPTKSREARV
jgi:hypothetical protein